MVSLRWILTTWSLLTALAGASLWGQAASDSAASDPCSVLVEAEALNSGSGGRYDPAAAVPLFKRAAATGCTEAVFRVALLTHMGTSGWRKDPSAAASLVGPVNQAVETKAAAGDSYCQYLVGTAWLVGLGRPVDYAKAREELHKAARGGQGWAYLNLGWMASQGFGLAAADSTAGMAAYCQAARLGFVSAMVSCGHYLAKPHNPPESCQRARAWYRKAADAGSPAAAKWLGQLLYYGREGCMDPDPLKAFPWLNKAAADDSPDALYNLAFALLIGDGGQRDVVRAVKLLRQAASGNVLSAELLSFLYETGWLVERDPAQAEHWREVAARQGSDGLNQWLRETTITPRALALYEKGMARLAKRVEDGDAAAGALLARRIFASGQAGDTKRARGLMREAAEAGSLTAMRWLGGALIRGEEVAKDTKAGLAWWRRCAQGSNSFCMMVLGNTLIQGEIVPRDLETGRGWLERAGEAGNWWAIVDLGHLYDEGWYGTARDLERAATWKRQLAKRGDAESRGWLRYHGYSLE